MDDDHSLLTERKPFGRPRLHISKTDEQDGDIPELRRKVAVWVQYQSMDCRLVNVPIMVQKAQCD